MTQRVHSIPDFRRLWFVGFVMFVVRWLEMLAVGVFAYQETHSAFIVALLAMLRLLPLGLFGAVLGAAADRMERRTALIVTVAAMMATTIAVGILAELGLLRVWHLAVVSFIGGIGWATDNPIRRMMIGDVVGLERMGPAMSIDVGSNNATRMLGPILGGLMLAHFGIAGVYWLATALYVLGLVAALRVDVRSRTGAGTSLPVLTGLREGLTWLRGDRRLIGVFLVTVIFNVFGWPFTSMIPVIGRDYLHLGPEGVGLLAGLDGIGAFAGALAIAAVARREWYGRLYLCGVVVYLAMIVVFAFAPSVPLAAMALLIVGFGGAGFNVMQTTLVYLYAPVEMRARLLGVLSVCIGSGPLGFFYLGFLADLLTAPIATVIMAAQGLLTLIVIKRYLRAFL